MIVETLDPNDIVVSVSGSRVSGFAKKMVEVKRLNPSVRDERDVDGNVIRYLADDRRGEIRIFLQPNMPGDIFLSTLVNADEIIGVNVFPVIIKDLRRLRTIVAPVSWIEAPPARSYSNSVETNTWVIKVADLRML